MNKNTIRKGKREIEINSEFWRAVIEQACINPMRYEIISRGQPGIEYDDE